MLSKNKTKHLREKHLLVLDAYSEVAGESSTRTWRVGLILILASIVTFISVLNSMQGDYFSKEYNQLHDSWNKALAHKKEVTGMTLKQMQAASIDSILLPDEEKTDFLSSRHIQSYRDYNNYDEMYRDMLKEAYLVRVPILDITFHINNLGFISTTMIFILFILFYSSLISELTNLEALFHKAVLIDQDIEEGATSYRLYLRHYFKIQAARQVVNIALDSFLRRPRISIGDRKEVQGESLELWLLRKLNPVSVAIIPVLLFLPSIACFTAIAHDILVSKDADDLDVKFWESFIFCGAVVIINMTCITLYRERDNIWRKYYFKVVEARQWETNRRKRVVLRGSQRSIN